MTQGKFIALEGLDSAGKTSNRAFLQSQIESQGFEVIVTREPGGTSLAEQIREVLISHHEEPVAAKTELLLLFAARAQHLEQVILPALKSGIWVISDRFVDASFAYQGGGRQIPESWIQLLSDFVVGSVLPDLVLYLDVSLETSRNRLQSRGGLDRFEVEQEAFFKRVRQVYIDRCAASPKTHLVINANDPLSTVKAELWASCQRHFPTMLVQAELS